MMPERNGVTVRFPNYGNKFARTDVYHLPGFGYAFIASIFYNNTPNSPGADFDADVDTSHDHNVLEKKLNNEPHEIIIVPYHCVTIYNDWMEHKPLTDVYK